MPQFVLLEHDHPRLHWDFMLEAGATLRTWRLDQIPDHDGMIPAEQLADHRLAYLDYEGPVSGNRGTVRRIDRGEFRMLEDQASRIVVQLDGLRLRGEVQLEQTADHEAGWSFHWRRFDGLDS